MNAEESFWNQLRENLGCPDGEHHSASQAARSSMNDRFAEDDGFSMEEAERLMQSDLERDAGPLSEAAIREMVGSAVGTLPRVRTRRPRLVVVEDGGAPVIGRIGVADRSVPVPVADAPVVSRGRGWRFGGASPWLAASVTGAALLLAAGAALSVWPINTQFPRDLSYAQAIDVMMGSHPSLATGRQLTEQYRFVVELSEHDFAAERQIVGAARVYSELKQGIAALATLRNSGGDCGTAALVGLKALEAAFVVSASSSPTEYIEVTSLHELAKEVLDPQAEGRQMLVNRLSTYTLYGLRAMIAVQRSSAPSREWGSASIEVSEMLRRLEKRVRRALQDN